MFDLALDLSIWGHELLIHKIWVNMYFRRLFMRQIIGIHEEQMRSVKTEYKNNAQTGNMYGYK